MFYLNSYADAPLNQSPTGSTQAMTETATNVTNSGGGAGGGGSFMPLLSIILVFVVFYFLLILPQKKQEKKQRAMIDALVPGDEVVTIGGIYGNVVSVKDDTLVIETSADKTKLKIAKSSVSRCVSAKEEEKK